MFTFLIVVITIIGALMVMVVLLQSGKGGGLSGMIPGNTTRDVLGARQAPDLLERATWTLATAFIVLCLLSNFVDGSGQTQGSIIQERSQQQPSSSQPATPGGQGGQPQTPTGGNQQQQSPAAPPAGGNGQSQAPSSQGGAQNK